MSWNPITWFPFTREGRQTLMYLVTAGCGVALTACVMWTLKIIETFPETPGQARLDAYVALAQPLGWALLIIVVAHACFVSIRAVKIKAGKDGIDGEMSGEGGGE